MLEVLVTNIKNNDSSCVSDFVGILNKLIVVIVLSLIYYEFWGSVNTKLFGRKIMTGLQLFKETGTKLTAKMYENVSY